MNPIDPIRRVGELRRHPTTCLYCLAKPDTDEHIVPEAIGGRLVAPILCQRHNSEASVVDAAVAEHYAFLTWLSNASRQRGGRERWDAGTRLRFVDLDGRETLIDPNGETQFERVVVERDDAGQVRRLDGPLDRVRRIADQQAGRGILVEVISPGVTIPVGIGITDDVLPGLLKIALHFAAGFVGGPPPATLAALHPYLSRARPVPAFLLPFRAPWFEPLAPARHEVTIYPDRDGAVVTIMLFSSIIGALRLPHFVTDRALRCVQLLDGTGPQLVDVEARPIPHEPLSEREIDGLLNTTRAVLTRMAAERHMIDLNDIAQTAAREALGQCARMGSDEPFFDFFRAALQRSPLHDPAEIETLVRQARARKAHGLNPVDLGPMVL